MLNDDNALRPIMLVKLRVEKPIDLEGALYAFEFNRRLYYNLLSRFTKQQLRLTLLKI